MSQPKDYDSTVARIAGNVLSGMISSRDFNAESEIDNMVTVAVEIARRIITATKRTEPPKDPK